MLGFVEQDELEGMPIMDMVVPDQQKEFKAFLRSLGKGDSANSQLELTCQKSDESTFSALLEFTRALGFEIRDTVEDPNLVEISLRL